MSKREIATRRPMRTPQIQPVTIGCYSLTAVGLEVRGRPSFAEHQGAGDFIQRAHQASGFWLADWLRYGESRTDWKDKIDQAVDATGMSLKTLKNVRAVGAIDISRRRDDVEFSLHEAVASLPAEDQEHWLETAALERLTLRELRLKLRAAKRRRILDGQAVLEGLHRVVYADPPWIYNDRPPSGSGQADHYDGMTIEQLCAMPIAAHCYPNAVLFLWVTAPVLLQTPGPREVITAWGFEYKTNQVWDKVVSAGGNYVAAKHEHLIIATRGSCTPDNPVPMPDSVIVERRTSDFGHSQKPASFRKQIERLYDGPYLELFARERTEGWTCFGNDAALWHQEAVTA